MDVCETETDVRRYLEDCHYLKERVELIREKSESGLQLIFLVKYKNIDDISRDLKLSKIL